MGTPPPYRQSLQRAFYGVHQGLKIVKNIGNLNRSSSTRSRLHATAVVESFPQHNGYPSRNVEILVNAVLLDGLPERSRSRIDWEYYIGRSRKVVFTWLGLPNPVALHKMLSGGQTVKVTSVGHKIRLIELLTTDILAYWSWKSVKNCGRGCAAKFRTEICIYSISYPPS